MQLKKKVLIIDDDRDILEALELIFIAEGYDTTISSGDDDVKQLISEYNPGLIILDVLLSGKDGRIICKALKADDLTRTLPVIMISAHPDARRSTLAVGADEFLAKPFDIYELLDKVQKYIGT